MPDPRLQIPQLNGGVLATAFDGTEKLAVVQGGVAKPGTVEQVRALVEAIKTANYTLLTTDKDKLLVGNSATAITFTLPAVATAGTSSRYHFRNINTGTLTLDANAAETIELGGSTGLTITLDKGDEAVLTNTGSLWRAVVTRAEGHLEPETSIASAATTDIGASTTERVLVTGTTTITSFGTRARQVRTVRFGGILVLTHNATTLILPTGANITTAVGDVAQFASDATGNWRCIHYQRASGEALSSAADKFPRGHLAGLTLSNNVTDAINDINIAAGEARDATNAQDMVLASTRTKQLDAVWAVGTNAGGRDTGPIADGWWYVWLIKRSDTGVVDVLFSASATAPTMPASYDFKRRIGAFHRNAAAIRAFHQYGDRFEWDAIILDLNSTAITTTATSIALSVPRIEGVVALIQGLVSHASGTPSVFITRPAVANDGNAPTARVAGTALIGYSAHVTVNGSGQVDVSSGSTATTVTIGTVAWIDRRGRDD